MKAKLILFFISFFCLVSCNNEAPEDAETPWEGNFMTLGVELIAPTPQPEKYKNDLIHPCIRYIAEGFAGHKWWMVATPYYGYNSAIENPILYFGDSRAGNLPPLNWTPIAIVQDTPPIGYNSDPSIYYDGTKLWVFWRENATPDCKIRALSRATFGASTIDGVTFSKKQLYAPEPMASYDSEMCPIIVNFDGKIRLYACSYKFPTIQRPQPESRGLAIWDIEQNDLTNNQFTLTKTIKQSCYPNFDFWHFDVFKHNSRYYCLVTPQSGEEILIGDSKDGEHFEFWDTPLLSTKECGAAYMYKPTGMVHQGVFYLWYPVRSKENINKIHMSEMPFVALIKRLKDTPKESIR